MIKVYKIKLFCMKLKLCSYPDNCWKCEKNLRIFYVRKKLISDSDEDNCNSDQRINPDNDLKFCECLT